MKLPILLTYEKPSMPDVIPESVSHVATINVEDREQALALDQIKSDIKKIHTLFMKNPTSPIAEVGEEICLLNRVFSLKLDSDFIDMYDNGEK